MILPNTAPTDEDPVTDQTIAPSQLSVTRWHRPTVRRYWTGAS